MAKRPTRLQRELQQTRPFRSPSHEAVVGLLRTADLVRRLHAAVVEPHGITLQQFNVLRILRGAGEAGLPTLEVASRMIEASPGITRLLDRLEAKALISRERCPQDRRQHLCRLTAAGARLVGLLDEPIDRAGSAAMRGLSAAEQQRLVRLLDGTRAAHD